MNTQSITDTSFASAGQQLLGWLGAFWNNLSEDPEFIRRYQLGKGILVGQLALLYEETAALQNRQAVPVMHRQRYYPITLHEVERNRGPAASVRVGSTPAPCIGPQISAPFQPDAVLPIGGFVQYAGVTSYALEDPTITGVETMLVDDLMAPTTVLINGVDFYVDNGTIFFLHGTDPFDSGAFPTRTSANGRASLMWAVDTLFDTQYVQNFIGYVFKSFENSTESYKRYLNAVWDMYNRGASIADFMAAVSALLDEPSIIEASEVVQYVLRKPGQHKVVTDKHVYTIAPESELAANVRPGATLVRGALLTTTLRLYDNLNPATIASTGLQQDIVALTLPPELFRADLKGGISATWGLEDLVRVGTDLNGNPKLQFPLHGDADDVEAFWQDFWRYNEVHGISGETCFRPYLDATVVPVDGAVYGRLSPLAYLLDTLKTNAVILVVGVDKLTSEGRSRMDKLALLQQAMPAHICLFVVERRDIGEETYRTGVELSESKLVADAVIKSDVAGPGLVAKHHLRYTDRVTARWIPECSA